MQFTQTIYLYLSINIWQSVDVSLSPKLSHPSILNPPDDLQLQMECENGGIVVAFHLSIDFLLTKKGT